MIQPLSVSLYIQPLRGCVVYSYSLFMLKPFGLLCFTPASAPLSHRFSSEYTGRLSGAEVYFLYGNRFIQMMRENLKLGMENTTMTPVTMRARLMPENSFMNKDAMKKVTRPSKTAMA